MVPDTNVLIAQVRGNPTGMWEDNDGHLYQALVMTNVAEDQSRHPLTIVAQNIFTKEVITQPVVYFLQSFKACDNISFPLQVH